MKRPKRALTDPLTKALTAYFVAAHEAGQRALKARDFKGVAKVVERQRELIEQRACLAKHRAIAPLP
jgi:hypothetical protein